MNKILYWIKSNKLSSALIAVLIVLVFLYGSPDLSLKATDLRGPVMESVSVGGSSGQAIPPRSGFAPQLEVTDRKVVTNSHLSLVVSDVNGSIKMITEHATSNGGYMVNANQTNPEGLARGDISIRIPSDRLDVTLEYLRGIATKVVSENINGRDVTDEYVDTQARLETLEGTKSRYESILNQATEVDEILKVTQQILYVQDQIDSLKGQLLYLDTTSRSSLITIYLSTDELELPFAPDQPWRPSVIFKYAVRSLVGTLRYFGELLIWIGVYTPIWLPVLVILILKKKGKILKKKIK